ncbi:tRNA (N6-threonylcarbamoyladenosine(37)-N6)-methyltransferase TrmO [Rhodospirillum rubrum]|uniref:tRNA (N6-threonylcarbamoyladenosine(37)-N6)-methyltransferase TrmO n=1 Tax=Rhodospirillum rubrum TaxID=1085 RepID=UPI0019066EBD|nr:tRNA (N6-threonylcarbamoyladenosine(37)-N6)-methyltransferase TrmO [Rhodospirillum rubrum]MBK1664108.1 tRNA (N6-threonylcarbamoyladenosine(37)-N6)-methyltransferase TrmO [Rhodospirillum rubrum]MBK1675583.1 tRNA (N6-threonylcarbamoyladenosine(37)-N6)-methyltransferase TrmO [Rhodospirillum rubrum]
MDDRREGEIALDFDPVTRKDASVAFIGHIQTPWTSRDEAPRNVIEARERSTEPARITLDPAFAPGLAGLAGHSHVVVLYWMDKARRDLIVQCPRHSAGPRGVFSLRSPLRPNPVALAAVPLLSVDIETGVLTVGPLDCLNGTPLIDIKPYYVSTDCHPTASSP